MINQALYMKTDQSVVLSGLDPVIGKNLELQSNRPFFTSNRHRHLNFQEVGRQIACDYPEKRRYFD